jgi:hypothetical protein
MPTIALAQAWITHFNIQRMQKGLERLRRQSSHALRR